MIESYRERADQLRAIAKSVYGKDRALLIKAAEDYERRPEPESLLDRTIRPFTDTPELPA